MPFVAVVLVGCPEPEPPPDIDTETLGDDEVGDNDGAFDEVVFDGQGTGIVWPVEIRDGTSQRTGAILGAPKETWAGFEALGQATALMRESPFDPPPELVAPMTSPNTFVEDLHPDVCPDGQEFVWDRQPNRKLGAAFTFYSRSLQGDKAAMDDGGQQYVWRTVPLIGAPTAGADSGRVMMWDRCTSCAFFPKPDGETNEQGGEFGTSMTVAMEYNDDVAVPEDEVLFIGSPAMNDGEVSVISSEAFRRWQIAPAGLSEGYRECQCLLDDSFGVIDNFDCEPWQGTLHGQFPNEEFGAAMVAGDLDCDGHDDLIIGAPGAELPDQNQVTIPEAGAVYVYMAADGPFGETFPAEIIREGSFEVGGTPEDLERFGHAVVVGNFNGARRVSDVGQLQDRSCFDLVVAAPGEDGGRGQVRVFEGSPQGIVYGGPVITLDDIFDQAADPGDRFGWAMTTGDFNSDDFDDLVVSSPWDAQGGTVVVIPGSPDGLDPDNATVLKQGLGGFGGSDELEDEFGYALSWTFLGNSSSPSGPVPRYMILVGVPGEDGGIGEVRTYQSATGDMLPMVFIENSGPVRQGQVFGDNVPGDRFGEAMMPTRAFPFFPEKLP